MSNRKEYLQYLKDQYSLTAEDYFLHKTQGWIIVTRSGIEKIQEAEGITVTYSLERCESGLVVILATATDGEKKMQSFGEANGKNCRNSYPVAMAEKRALSRVVLKSIGAYAEGAKGEDEIEENG